MPSFDVVSTIEKYKLINALDQTRREISTRFDFKNVPTNIEYKEKDNELHLAAPSDFQLTQLRAALETKLIKSDLDLQSLDYTEPIINLQECRQIIKLKQGIEQDISKKISKLVKDNKFKVQAVIQGDKVRITGKNRDELQAIMQLIRSTELGLPLQFDNFRD